MVVENLTNQIQQHNIDDTCLYESVSLNKVVLVKVERVDYTEGIFNYLVRTINEEPELCAYVRAHQLTRALNSKTFSLPSEDELDLIVGGES